MSCAAARKMSIGLTARLLASLSHRFDASFSMSLMQCDLRQRLVEHVADEVANAANARKPGPLPGILPAVAQRLDQRIGLVRFLVVARQPDRPPCEQRSVPF